MPVQYSIGDKVKMKKSHPCGGDLWEITRIGMDFRIKCLKCERQLLIPRIKFEKNCKQIIEKKAE